MFRVLFKRQFTHDTISINKEKPNKSSFGIFFGGYHSANTIKTEMNFLPRIYWGLINNSFPASSIIVSLQVQNWTNFGPKFFILRRSILPNSNKCWDQRIRLKHFFITGIFLTKCITFQRIDMHLSIQKSSRWTGEQNEDGWNVVWK